SAVVEQTSAEIAATTAEVTRSQYDLVRYRTLSADRFASIQRFEQADADYKKAIAAERKAQAALQAAQRQLDVIDSETRQIEAALAQAKSPPTARCHSSPCRSGSPISTHRAACSGGR